MRGGHRTTVAASHMTAAAHAVTGHAVTHDLPLFWDLRVRGDRIEVSMYELAFDAWVASVTSDGQVLDEVESGFVSDTATRVHVDAILPATGVRVRLISSRPVTVPVRQLYEVHESDWSSETSPASPWAEAAMGIES